MDNTTPPVSTHVQSRTRALIAVGLIALGGCATLHTPADLAREQIELPPRSVAIFFVDGLDKTRLTEMLRAEELPNIRKRFVDGGVAVDRAVTSIPAITYPNAVSLITGCFPGHHGILGNRWFDRFELRTGSYFGAHNYRDVNQHFRNPTLYELLPDHLSVSVQNHTRRGATHAVDHLFFAGIKRAFHLFSMIDDRVGDMDRIESLVRQVRRWPSVVMFYFPGTDDVGHQSGSTSEAYASAVRTVDAAIGRACDTIERLGLMDQTYLILVTDHSHPATEPDKEFDLDEWVEHQFHGKVFKDDLFGKSLLIRSQRLGEAEAVLINGAYRTASLHLRGSRGWHHRPTEGEIESWLGGQVHLDELPAVALVARRAGEDRVRVSTSGGECIVERQLNGGFKEYRLISVRGQAISYQLSPEFSALGEGAWGASGDWLSATADQRLPDFVPQIMEMFDSPRSGDIVFFASEGWSFKKHEPGGHGSCVGADMMIPMYFAGPDLPKGAHVRTARLVDVMPTVLAFLNEESRLRNSSPIDGVNLFPELLSAAGASRP